MNARHSARNENLRTGWIPEHPKSGLLSHLALRGEDTHPGGHVNPRAPGATR